MITVSILQMSPDNFGSLSNFCCMCFRLRVLRPKLLILFRVQNRVINNEEYFPSNVLNGYNIVQARRFIFMVSAITCA